MVGGAGQGRGVSEALLPMRPTLDTPDFSSHTSGPLDQEELATQGHNFTGFAARPQEDPGVEKEQLKGNVGRGEKTQHSKLL